MHIRASSLWLICLCILLPCIAGAEETVGSIHEDTAVYYTQDGGVYYHLDPKCSSVHENYRAIFAKFNYSELFSDHWSLLPCENCVDPDTQTLWIGERELREAMPTLQSYLEEVGLPFAAPYAWRITPQKDELSVVIRDEHIYEFELHLSEGSWKVREQ